MKTVFNLQQVQFIQQVSNPKIEDFIAKTSCMSFFLGSFEYTLRVIFLKDFQREMGAISNLVKINSNVFLFFLSKQLRGMSMM